MSLGPSCGVLAFTSIWLPCPGRSCGHGNSWRWTWLSDVGIKNPNPWLLTRIHCMPTYAKCVYSRPDICLDYCFKLIQCFFQIADLAREYCIPADNNIMCMYSWQSRTLAAVVLKRLLTLALVCYHQLILQDLIGLYRETSWCLPGAWSSDPCVCVWFYRYVYVLSAGPRGVQNSVLNIKRSVLCIPVTSFYY